MKICIPVASSDGLAASVDPAQPDTRFLHLHDLDTDSFELIDLNQPTANDGAVAFDAVICAAISKPVFGALRQQGKDVFLTEAATVADALAEFASGKMYRIPDQAAGCGGGCDGGGCHGHDDDHAHDHGPAHGGCQCQSSEADGHAHSHGGCGSHGPAHGGGGCGCGGHEHDHADTGSGANRHSAAHAAVVRGDTLRIAVTSQNRKQITEHAGKCRKFWIYETRAKAVVSKTLLELPLEQSLHASAGDDPHPLDSIDLLITGGIGDGLRQRLADRGVETIVTTETDPDAVVGRIIATP